MKVSIHSLTHTLTATGVGNIVLVDKIIVSSWWRTFSQSKVSTHEWQTLTECLQPVALLQQKSDVRKHQKYQLIVHSSSADEFVCASVLAPLQLHTLTLIYSPMHDTTKSLNSSKTYRSLTVQSRKYTCNKLQINFLHDGSTNASASNVFIVQRILTC